MMQRSEFREDLYYRLKVIEVTVPSLRERREEIPRLTDFFIARYARKYNRAARTVSDALRQRFLDYEWPGNIRELENMIKRMVILQDEQMVLRELIRAPQRAPVYVAAAAGGPTPGSGGYVPPAFVSTSAPDGAAAPAAPGNGDVPSSGDDELDKADAGSDDDAAAEPGASPKLADVARTAALKAERAVIEQTLRQVHWNRRKAAQLLGVSYKTLLNKIKECGISRR
jgi:DNA-binding NtrC family response regulator